MLKKVVLFVLMVVEIGGALALNWLVGRFLSNMFPVYFDNLPVWVAGFFGLLFLYIVFLVLAFFVQINWELCGRLFKKEKKDA